MSDIDIRESDIELADDEGTKTLTFGSEIKLREDGVAEGYLVLFGHPDEADFDRDYFDDTTDFDLEPFSEGDEQLIEVTEGMVKAYAHGKSTVYFNHGFDPVIGKHKLGGGMKAKLSLTDKGVWVQAKLKEGEEYDEMVKELMRRRPVGWSSGVPSHLIEKQRVGKAQHIKRWPLGTDASITHTPNDWRNPQFARLKSIGDFLKELETVEEESPVGTENLDTSEHLKTTIDIQPEQQEILDMAIEAIKMERVVVAALNAVIGELKLKMTGEELEQAKSAASAALTKMVGEDEPEEEQMMKSVTSPEFSVELAKIAREVQGIQDSRVADAVKANLANVRPVSQVGDYAPKSVPAPRIEVRSPYADLKAEDMAYLHMLRKTAAHARSDYDYHPDIKFTREALDKAQKAYQKGELKLDVTDPAIKTLTAVKANELDSAAQAGYGDEWVPNIWSADLWLLTRLDNVVLPRLGMVEMPSNPYELPIQSTDPTVFFVPETTNEDQLTLDASTSPIPDSKVATSKVSITASKLGLRVGISAEVEEDSIIPFIAESRAQAMRSIMDSMDNVVLNGDTATSLNINADGATPAATAKYMAFNGIIKNVLVTNTAYSINASGATPTLSLMRRARALLRSAYAMDIRNLMWITDFSTYMKLLAIDEVSSAANRGSLPTGMTGVLGGIDGIDLYVSNEMALADEDGKVTSGGNTTNRGRALLVHKPTWRTGFRRRVTSSLRFFPEYDSYQMTVTVRLGLINRDSQGAAIIYNVGI